MLRHVLMSGSYRTPDKGSPAILNADFSGAFEQVVLRNGVEPVTCVSYTTVYQHDPVRYGLKDAWINMTTAERQSVQKNFPALFDAIFMLITGAVPRDEKNDR